MPPHHAVKPAPLDWLLEGPAFVRYRAMLDLMASTEVDPDAAAARSAMLGDPRVRTLLAELAHWPGRVIASHKSAGQPFHKLTFLADIGVRSGDPGVAVVCERILALQTVEGPFGLPAAVGTTHGHPGQEVTGWALCDAPLVVYALVSLGVGGDARVTAAVEHLVSLARENGWPCAVSAALGGWRGPGRREDPCPFANLAMLKALSALPAWRDGPEARMGCDTLLGLWSESRIRHPYQFYMGTDFRKLKAPLVWYDLLHVLDVLSRYPHLRQDPRLREMAELLEAQADEEGRFTAQSVWRAWSQWEFGQKREPSRWLTLLAWRIRRRLAD